ncbi:MULTISPECIES: hypothetical protein [unclassified Anabaena]|uniref:hypothetical protein n=1 Tax=unclassified Anabaena TaxID=2619674 RepID=UPI0039C6EABE
MSDLVTYYGQTNRIDKLVEKYGDYLEKLDRETKLLLRITLSTYVFMQEEQNPTDYLVTTALENALYELVIADSLPQDLFDVCQQLERLSIDEAETLLEALQHQIRWGNAQVVVNR